MGIMAQIGIVLAVCLVGEGIAALLPIPFPASVISMVLLFLLLATKLLRPHHIKEKSNFLITNMACLARLSEIRKTACSTSPRLVPVTIMKKPPVCIPICPC